MRAPWFFASALAAVVVFGGAPGAHADCAGPSITYEAATVDRGDTVVVTGNAWGDNCYDTGPPPDGEGALGVPAEDIDLVLVQGDREVVLATGDADDEYGFEVAVTIPDMVEPGPATIVARTDRTEAPAMAAGDPVELTISDAPTTGQIHQRQTFGPDGGEAPTEPSTTMAPTDGDDATIEQGPSTSAPADDGDGDDGDGYAPIVWAVGGVVVLIATIGLVVTAVRDRRTSTD